MYNRPPMQIDPVFSDEDGSYVGSEVHQPRPYLHNGTLPDWETQFEEDSEGRMVWRFDEEDPSYYDDNSFDEEEYIEALVDSLPVDYNDVIQWASQNLPNEILENYNSKIDTADLEGLNEAIEQMLEFYYEANGEPTEAEDEVEVSDEEFVEAYSELTSNEAQGTEVAFAYLEAAEQAEDPAYRDALMATADFHRGEVTAEEAMEWVINKHGLAKAAEIYKHLNQ